MRLVRAAPFVVALSAATACGSPYSGEGMAPGGQDDGGQGDGGPTVSDASDAPDTGPVSTLPECKAQRVVGIESGYGALAWFTLLWPVPVVVTSFNSAWAVDSPDRVTAVTNTGHPLYARKVAGGRALWEGTGAAPHPTVILGASNQTHTNEPGHLKVGTVDLFAASVAAQASFAAGFPLVELGSAVVGSAPNAPAVIPFANVTEAIQAAEQFKLSPADRAALTPDDAKVKAWLAGSTYPTLEPLARSLIFIATALRLNILGTIVLRAGLDDPHLAFNNGDAAPVADAIAHVLDSFYAELATFDEPSCSRAGRPVKLADNVAMVVFGDTPHNSFQNNGWPDDSPAASNWIYVRSNGFLQPGWFGRVVSASEVTYFDPTNGVALANASQSGSLGAMQAAVLHVATRGDKAAVEAVTTAPYAGLVATPP